MQKLLIVKEDIQASKRLKMQNTEEIQKIKGHKRL
jgi:hypothetical protein